MQRCYAKWSSKHVLLIQYDIPKSHVTRVWVSVLSIMIKFNLFHHQLLPYTSNHRPTNETAAMEDHSIPYVSRIPKFKVVPKTIG